MGVYYWVGTQGGLLRHFSPIKLTSAPAILTIHVVVLGVALTVADVLGRDLVDGGLVASLRTTAALLFVAAGLVGLMRWRVTAESPAALLGLALAVYGGLAVPLVGVSGLGYDGGAQLHPVSGLLATVAAAVPVLAALGAPHLGRRSHVAGVALATLVPPVAGIGLLVLLGQTSSAEGTLAPGTHVDLELTAAAIWAGLAAAFAAKGRRFGERWLSRAAALMVGLVAAGLCRAAAVSDNATWSFPAAALLFATAGLTLTVTLVDFRAGSLARNLDHRAVKTALARAEDVLAEQQEWRRHLAHDSRNATAALRMAMTALTLNADRLSTAAAAELRRSVMDEITHLEQLLRRADTPAMEEFAVADVLTPIVSAQREGGLEIHVEPGDATVRGYPDDLEVVLGMLISNLQPLAAGQQLTLSVETDHPRVRVELARRSVQNARSRGRDRSDLGSYGLGLYVADRLMANQGGTIDHHVTAAGESCYTLTLAAAGSDQADPTIGTER